MNIVLLTARHRGGVGPFHAIEALVEPGEETILNDRTVCNRLPTHQTDAVAVDHPETRWLRVPAEERCASCAYFAAARDAGMRPVIAHYDGTARGHEDDGGDRWDLPELRPQPDSPKEIPTNP